MDDEPGLFPELTSPLRPYCIADLRVGQVDAIRVVWAPVKLTRPVPCDECAELEHATHGAVRRLDARQRRTAHMAGGGKDVTMLCTRHADLWRAKDYLEGMIR